MKITLEATPDEMILSKNFFGKTIHFSVFKLADFLVSMLDRKRINYMVYGHQDKKTGEGKFVIDILTDKKGDICRN